MPAPTPPSSRRPWWAPAELPSDDVERADRLLWLVRASFQLDDPGERGHVGDVADLGPITADDVRLAQAHHVHADVARLAPLVGVHDEAAAALADRRRWDRLLALGLRAAAISLVQSMAEHGVRVAVFKGLVLAAQTGVPPEDRPGSDLDLLIRPDDWITAHRVLVDAGFDQSEMAPPPGRDTRTRFVQATYSECAYRRGDLEVDLHWRVCPGHPRRLTTDHLLGRAVPIAVRDTMLPTFHPDDALAHVWLNGAKDRWARLRSTVDAHRLVSIAGADPDRAAALLDGSVAATEGRAGLRVLTDQPPTGNGEPTGGGGTAGAGEARRVWVTGLVTRPSHDRTTGRPPEGRVGGIRRDLALVPGTRSALAGAGHLLAPPWALQRSRLPARGWLLAVAARPVRITRLAVTRSLTRLVRRR